MSILDRGKKLASSPAVMKLLASDRVMKVASGVLEARERFGEAAVLWREGLKVLANGHEMPNLDPSLASDDERMSRTGKAFTSRQLADEYAFQDVDGTLPNASPPSRL